MALAACSPTRVTSGNLPDPDKVAQIEPGKQTRAQVAALLGTPSSVSTFDGQAWYYIGKRTERLAFFDPKLLEQQVVVIEFDESGVVRRIRQLTEKDGYPVQMVERVTPSPGRELGFFEQMIGNLPAIGGRTR